MPDTARTTILLTGFQPFPTQPVNATAELVPQLAVLARRLFPDVRFIDDVLPTEWRAGPWRLEHLIIAHKPDALISFGIASRAKGFEIEMRGRNKRSELEDAAERTADKPIIAPDAAETLPGSLPVGDIIRRLRHRAIPVLPSRNAGLYLCNAVLFHALTVAPHIDDLRHVGFVHLPAELGVPGRRQTNVNRSCPITWEQTVIGSLEIIAACLGRALPPQINMRPRPRIRQASQSRQDAPKTKLRAGSRRR